MGSFIRDLRGGGEKHSKTGLPESEGTSRLISQICSSMIHLPYSRLGIHLFLEKSPGMENRGLGKSGNCEVWCILKGQLVSGKE